MICNQKVEKYCSEDIYQIENYAKAVNDDTQTWHCHHRLEIKDNGTTISQEELLYSFIGIQNMKDKSSK